MIMNKPKQGLFNEAEGLMRRIDKSLERSRLVIDGYKKRKVKEATK